MTTCSISESGMVFGPYPSDDCFHIEKSLYYQNANQGVQMAEFLLLKKSPGSHPVIWVIEAKSSSPRPATQPHFAGFIQEVRKKFTNALLLTIAARLGRHPTTQAALPRSFQTVDLQNSHFRFVLVIHGHDKRWLPPLQRALLQAMQSVQKTWALPPNSVAVLNHEQAQQYGLI